MINVNVVFIREEAKHTRDTHWHTVSMQNFNSSTQLIFQQSETTLGSNNKVTM